MAESIEMLSRMLTHVGPRNYILDWSPDGRSRGNEKILEDAYRLIVKYSDYAVWV